jgi:hypothetical protein
MQKVVGSSPIVWTGREMLVFGGWNGNSEAADAATYDPRTNRWRRVPDWRPRWQNAAAWTGKRLIVWGGDGGDDYVADGVAFNYRTERWTLLPRSPLGPRGNASAAKT